MAGNLDDLYLEYLYDYVGLPKRGRNRSHHQLFAQMYAKEFLWVLTLDGDRAEDGKELRWEFVAAAGIRRTPAQWLYQPCSFLEMLIFVARRVVSLTDGNLRDWFGQLLYNLELDMATDMRIHTMGALVDTKMDAVMGRTYASNGQGGLFPLERPALDQRRVDIYHQMNAWLIEKSRHG